MDRYEKESIIQALVLPDDIKFCGGCGHPLVVSNIKEKDGEVTRFDRKTGEKMYFVELKCSNNKGYCDLFKFWQTKDGRVREF